MPHKLPSGNWRAQFRHPHTSELIRARGSFKDRKQALAWETIERAKALRGQWIDPEDGKVTFAEYFEDYAKGKGWTPGSERAARLAFADVTFADMPLRMIRKTHVGQWITALHAKGLAPGTVRTRVGYIAAVFRQAVEEDMIERSPIKDKDKRVPKRSDAVLPEDLATVEQVSALMRATDPAFVAFVALCAFAGLRLGEAAGLRVGDVDFLRTKTIKVQRQVQRENGCAVRICPPKYDSRRTIDAPDELLTIISEHIRVNLGSVEQDDWLFPGEAGHPLHQNSAAYWWRKAKTAARVTVTGTGDRPMRLHDLRHFFASGLIHAGLDVTKVAAALGHKNTTMTLRTYTHLWPKSEAVTRAAATSLMADTMKREPRLSHERLAK